MNVELARCCRAQREEVNVCAYQEVFQAIEDPGCIYIEFTVRVLRPALYRRQKTRSASLLLLLEQPVNSGPVVFSSLTLAPTCF